MHADFTALLRFVLVAALCGTVASSAHATLQFQKVFLREYIADHPDREFAEFVTRKARCNICHQGCKDRTLHNRYGAELAALLDHRTDKNDVEKVTAALRAVANMPSDPAQPSSPTFGDRIHGSKLPAGELNELKKEPAY